MYINLVMLIMLFTEKVYMAIVVAFNKLFGKTPEKRYKFEPFEDDVELGSSIYPLVLVQVPMFNEKEVYHLSIGVACGLSWPSDCIIIQVLDDSTDPLIKVHILHFTNCDNLYYFRKENTTLQAFNDTLYIFKVV
ncbi:putative glucomannan 4-beta-mannosyltransferase [Helianthus annuus]|uniref:Glucomannan 4-beta-mannosyltransferase n=1 Tax=Helianthus annuus TaxID=4232 RepID=A0A251SK98_HELAN|nr:putative glucomannan 4-beta-mannosyltransferase [Helianthus annuus]KAJ0465102.1 putative glucomannan 4-beta-mannosyltransferase [Helianthus annuus]KAJ0469812.1 putative glucomannan 4-beta-mannosyltransferase [Helianthus annuus]KAJ0486694.1 putative glucomannan 4-beta-mannosyltransferase [Helianthus annuus]KAJ0660825.1 putative glucomannan 4-beta-mannosyltransferase [Helianthus annuus]